ncbi:MAG: hypothetical protein K0U98_08785 [Deltaproteobacteria bacterium]|nr:hypothetical protein [Deltaproteobacteria bacterium]
MIPRTTALALTVIALISALVAFNAAAQVDPGMKILIQVDSQVGVLWVPERLPEACEYQEHWYLFPEYRYPGDEHAIDTVIRPEPDLGFDNLEEFLAVMESEYPDGRHITTIAIEHREDCP